MATDGGLSPNGSVKRCFNITAANGFFFCFDKLAAGGRSQLNASYKFRELLFKSLSAETLPFLSASLFETFHISRSKSEMHLD